MEYRFTSFPTLDTTALDTTTLDTTTLDTTTLASITLTIATLAIQLNTPTLDNSSVFCSATDVEVFVQREDLISRQAE